MAGCEKWGWGWAGTSKTAVRCVALRDLLQTRREWSGDIVIVDCRANMEEIFREGGRHFRNPVLSGKMSTKRRIIENK
jgi:hypothetical protein